MKTYIDKQRLLNIHPLTIYVYLSDEEKQAYGSEIKRLNRYKTVTRGVFKFKVLQSPGNFREDMPKDLVSMVKSNNIMVRLLNLAGDDFSYAFHRIDFFENALDVDSSLQEFITEVCKYNAQIFESTISYEHDREKKTQFEKLLALFREAALPKRTNKGAWERISAPENEVVVANAMPFGLRGVLDRVGAVVPPQKKEERGLFAVLNKFLESMCENYPEEISKLFEDSVTVPEVKIELKKIPTTFRGRLKHKYGVEIHVGDEVVAVDFGSKNCTMIYLCTLLQQKNNCPLRRAHFQIAPSSTKVQWMRIVYDTIFPSDATDFDSWYNRLCQNGHRGVNQGKSNCNSKISKALKSYIMAAKFCEIQSVKKDDHTFYQIDIPSEKIIIPSELEEICQGDLTQISVV